MSEQAFDLERLVARIVSRWKVHLVTALVAGALMYGVTWLMPTWYRATAVILPPEETDQMTSGLNVQRFLSRMPSIAGLSNYYTPSDIYRAILASRSVQQAVAEKFDLLKVYKKKSMEKTLREFSNHARVVLMPDGTITVSVEDRSRERSAAMANALIAELDRFNVERRNTQARRTRLFLEKRVAETDSLSRKAEAALRAYQEEHHIVVPTDIKDADTRPVADLLARKMSLEVELSILRTYLDDRHERVRQVQTELAGILRQIGSLPRLENELARLIRDARLYQQAYLMLTGLLEDARIRETMDTPTLTVLDDAIPPERRARPVRWMWVAAAMALAAAASALWAPRVKPDLASVEPARIAR